MSSFPGLGPCPPGWGNSDESPNLGESPNFCLTPTLEKGSHCRGHLVREMLVGILLCRIAHIPSSLHPQALPNNTASSMTGQVRARVVQPRPSPHPLGFSSTMKQQCSRGFSLFQPQPLTLVEGLPRNYNPPHLCIG